MFKKLRMYFDKPAEGAGAAGETTETTTEAPSETTASTEEATTEETPKPDKVDALSDKVDGIAKAVSSLTDNMNKPVEKAPEGASKEYTLEELRGLENQVNSGELGREWMSVISEKRARIISQETADSTTKRLELQNGWNMSHRKMTDKWSDLKDTNSEHFKLSQQYLLNDPGYKKYSALAQKGIKVDPDIIDSDLPFKCAKQAKLDLMEKEEGKPKGTSKNAAKASLGGNTMPVADQGRLATLEKAAQDSGNPMDWKNYFAARAKVKNLV